MNEGHLRKRESVWGRWVPAAFYALNFALWLITGVIVGAWDLLYLAALSIPALFLYLWRTR